jgi:hypothetical protein
MGPEHVVRRVTDENERERKEISKVMQLITIETCHREMETPMHPRSGMGNQLWMACTAMPLALGSVV